MKFQDFQCSKCSHPAHIPFSVQWSEDDIVALASEKGVFITILESLPKSKNPVLHTTRHYIPCSKTCPTAACGLDLNEISKEYDEHKMYQLVQDITLSPAFKNSTFIPSVKQFGWSPVVQKHKLRSLLGVLTDSGSLNLYYIWRGKWIADSTISTEWLNYCSAQWQETPSDSNKALDELKHRAYKLKISAFAWGDILDKQWYLLVTSSMDGTLVAWKVHQETETKTIVVQLLQELPLPDSYRSPITALHCSSIKENTYMIVVCYLDGRITNTVMKSCSENVIIIKQNILWEDIDKIRVYSGGLLLKNTYDGLVLVVVKGSFILVFYINSFGEMNSYEVVNSQELLLTGLANFSIDSLLVTAYSGSMFMLNVKKTDFVFKKIQNSLRGSHFSCNGLALSKSKALAVVPYSVRANYDHLSMKDLCHMLWCSVSEQSTLTSLILTHTGPLSDIWDVLELLRIEYIMNNNEDTWVSLNTFFASITSDQLDTMEIDKLKKNLAILKILRQIDREPIKYTKVELADIENDMIELIMSYYVFKKITNNTKENLSDFEAKSFALMKKWLGYILTKYSSKYSFTSTTASTLLEEFSIDIVDYEREYCIICEKEVPQFEGTNIAICLEGHIVPRCCLSLVQCGPLAYYRCPKCDVIAHPEAVSEETNSCIYCDTTFKFTEVI